MTVAIFSDSDELQSIIDSNSMPLQTGPFYHPGIVAETIGLKKYGERKE